VDAESGDELWYKPLDNISFSSPVVVNGKVYVTSTDYVEQISKLYCYNAENGGYQWTFYTDSPYLVPFGSSPAVAEGFVYFICYHEDEFQGRMYCVNADNGGYEWAKNVGFISDTVSSSVLYADGRVLMCALKPVVQEYYVYCLDALTGETKWEYHLGDMEVLVSTPAFDGTRVYLITLDAWMYGTGIHCIDLESGSNVWKRMIGDFEIILGSPAVADEKIYCASFMYGKMYCLSTQDGSTLWTYSLNYFTSSSPAVADEQVYIADALGNIYAFEDVLKISRISGGIASVKADIENSGESIITNVNWSIRVVGGLLGLLDRQVTGDIPSLESGAVERVRAMPILGLGPVTITVSASAPGVGTARITRNGFLLGFITVVLPN
jgi:outer membrane protein assembly factor BamB